MDRPTWVTNEHHWRENCREVVQCCQDLMEGRLGVIEAARLLQELAFRVRAEEDPDFKLFRFLDSESDALPVGPQRQYWSVSALEREDAKVAAFEENWRGKACLSAANLAERYAGPANPAEHRSP
jgi:hypothetical protein